MPPRKILKFEHSEIDSESNFERKIELTDIDLILVLDFLELPESDGTTVGEQSWP
jgi:hypothetical protein